jgi:colicin import membrane protein
MPGFVREHLRPLAGSAGLHLLLLAVFAGAALHWTSSQPPVDLAIEGYVVDSAPSDRPATKSRRIEPAPPPQVENTPPPEPSTEDLESRRAEEAAAVERAARQQREAERRAEREAAEERQRAADALEAKRMAAAEEAKRLMAEQEARRKAAEEEAKRKAEAEEARRKAEAEEAKRKADAKAQAEREAALQRKLAAEEEAGALVSSGVMDEYRSVLSQAIERNWIRPPSARAGLKCTLFVTQAPGGTVMDVALGDCNGDAAVRESIKNAVFRASPLPAPRDPRAFERRLEIVFKPTE